MLTKYEFLNCLLKVSTWKRDENSKIILADDNKPILRILFIKRGDNGEMALPGIWKKPSGID